MQGHVIYGRYFFTTYAIKKESEGIKMKRIVVVLLLVVTLLSVVACSGVGSFQIEGKWKNTGSDGFGQAQPGSIVVFDGTNCNFYSPSDTYAFYKEGNHYVLDLTSFLFGENLSFTVNVKDKNHMTITDGDWSVEMTRVQ